MTSTMSITIVSGGMTLGTPNIVYFLSKNFLKTFIFREVQDLYKKATFKLGEDYTIEACHNDMKHMDKNLGFRGGFVGNHPACKNLTLEDDQSLVFEGGQFVSVDVKEIKTIHSGICIGKFKILEQF